MPNIDPRAAMKIQSEMNSGESVYWAGMPDPTVIFHSDDWALIPFSLFWGGFAIFWESRVLGIGEMVRSGVPSTFMALWGIPFIMAGQYLIWGRFVFDGWLKRRTYYGLTNRRVLVVQEGFKRKVSWTYLESIPGIEREGGMTGSLWFGTKLSVFGSGGQKKRSMSRLAIGDTPMFADINDVDGVQRLIMELREKARKESHPPDASDSGPISYSPNS
jgi:hypothetical protein